MVQEIYIRDDGIFPGNRLPALLYKQALDIPLIFPAGCVREKFAERNWTNSWDAGIFTFHHYHSITHEVLGVYSGKAQVQLGGDHGPVLDLEKGDVLVIPAGVAHRNLSKENDIAVVGAYPDARDYDMNYGRSGERPGVDRRIAQVPMPDHDPLGGRFGELTRIWSVKQ
ncbi:cupin domain-containing protein [Mucilaginibacter rubeus]|uniref:Cupin domain-containing protein n=1 Tax=Mucilaginibacter rubeus TaxID=2027860 RepID=A0A5C1HVT7_9SPHI|nr:cupin domain-containing protein [Mucilaginibacter rubeus]QEM09982.1 cupin domain-containing protein [Mucilaginibacter rubeus]